MVGYTTAFSLECGGWGVGGGGQKVSNVNKDLFIYEVKRPLAF